MRSVFYRTIMVYFFVGLFALAMAPIAAQATSNQLTKETVATVDHSGPGANTGNMGFSAEAKAGASQSPMANSLIDCQKALLGKFCALPAWELGRGTSGDRHGPRTMN